MTDPTTEAPETEAPEAEAEDTFNDTDEPSTGMFVVFVGRPRRKGHRTMQGFIDSERARIQRQLDRVDVDMDPIAAKARLLDRLQRWADRDAAL